MLHRIAPWLSPRHARARAHAFVAVAIALAALACQDREVTASGAEVPQIEMKGVLEPVQSLIVSAVIDGAVSDLSAREGDVVTTGKPLLTITNPAVQRDQELARTQLAIATARAQRREAPTSSGVSRERRDATQRIVALRRQRLERLRALRATHDVSEQEVEQAESEYLAALRDAASDRREVVQGSDGRILDMELERAKAEARYAEGRTAMLQVTAPIAGAITRVHVTRGQAVFPRDPLVDITDTSSLRARAEVAPELSRFVRPGTRVDIKVFSVPPRTFVAEVERVVPVQDPSTGTRAAAVYATLANPDNALQPNTPISMTVRSPR